MISLFIDALPVDLSDTSPVQLTYDVRNAQELGSVTGYGSYTVKIPTTPRNERIFGSVWDYDVVDTEPKTDPRRERPCILLLDGEVIIRGFCLLLEWSRLEYQIQITGGNKGWGTPFKTRKLREVNLDPTNWRWDRWIYDNNICEYVKSLARTGSVVSDFDSPSVSVDALHNDFQLCTFPPVDWGGVTITNATTEILLKDQRPACYVRALLLAHFAELGYRVVSEWLTSDAGGKTLATLFNGTFPDATQACEDNVLSVDLGSQAPPQPNGAVTNGGLTYAPVASGSDSFDVLAEFRTQTKAGVNRYFFKPRRPDICYTVRYEFVLPNNNEWTLHLIYAPAGPLLGATTLDTETYIGQGGVTIVYEFSFTLDTSQVSVGNAVVRPSLVETLGTGARPTWNDGKLYRTTGGTFDLRDTLPDMTVADLVRALVAMFNLYLWTDDNEKTVNIEPYTSFFVDRNLDITPSLDTTKAEVHTNITPTPLNRIFRYQDDDADAGLTLYKEVNGDTFGTYETHPELTAKSELAVPVFAPTICDRLTSQDIWIPTLLSAEDPPVFTTDFAPRIVRVERRTAPETVNIRYLIPILACGSPPVNYTALTTFSGTIWQNAYFSVLSTLPLVERAKGLTFNASTDAVLGASDGLYFLYYEDEVSVLEPGRQIKARFVLANRLTIKKLTDFRTLVRMHGHIFQVVKVDKYQPGGDDRVEATLLLRI